VGGHGVVSGAGGAGGACGACGVVGDEFTAIWVIWCDILFAAYEFISKPFPNQSNRIIS